MKNAGDRRDTLGGYDLDLRAAGLLPVSKELALPAGTELISTGRSHRTVRIGNAVEEFTDPASGAAYFEIQQNPRLQIFATEFITRFVPVCKIVTIMGDRRTRYFSKGALYDHPRKTYSVGELLADEMFLGSLFGSNDHLVKSRTNRHGVRNADEDIYLLNGVAQKVEGVGSHRYAASWFDFGKLEIFKVSFRDERAIEDCSNGIRRSLNYFTPDLREETLTSLEEKILRFSEHISGEKGLQFIQSLLLRSGIPDDSRLVEIQSGLSQATLSSYLQDVFLRRLAMVKERLVEFRESAL